MLLTSFSRFRYLILRAFRFAGESFRPSYESGPALDAAEWRRQHDEISKTIWNLASLLVGSCVFCLITLGAPDASLVSSDARIVIPVANTSVSYTGFLFFGPAVLIGLNLYLHVYLEQRLRMGASKGQPLSPFVFNMGMPSANLLSAFLFYWMLPCVLAVFAWKALPRPDAPLLILLTCAVTGLMLILAIRRFDVERREPRSFSGRLVLSALWLLLSACVVLLFPLAQLSGRILLGLTASEFGESTEQTADSENRTRWYSALLPTRRLQLFGASLDKKNLSGLYAPSADMRKADLQETDLEDANLSHADMREANLTKAHLNHADLTGAQLDEFTQIDIKWRMVACVVSPECLKRPDLAWTDLSSANLRASKLKDQDMTGVNLRYSDLSGSDMKGAVLLFADLRNARLPASIAEAVVDGSLTTDQPEVRGFREDASVLLENRETQSCMWAPPGPANSEHPSMTESPDCSKSREQRSTWNAHRNPDGYIIFRTVVPGSNGDSFCLDGTSAPPDGDGVMVQVWQCNEVYPNQHWRVTPRTDGFVSLSKEDTQFCLDGPRHGQPTPYMTECRSDDHHQHWKIVVQHSGAPGSPQGNQSRQRRQEDLVKTARRFAVSPGGTSYGYRGPYYSGRYRAYSGSRYGHRPLGSRRVHQPVSPPNTPK